MKRLQTKDIPIFVMLLIVIIINTSDFIKDIHEGDDILHIALEVITVFLSIWGLWILRKMITSRNTELSNLNDKIEKAEEDLDLSHTKLKEIGKEYSRYIQKQFTTWQLTQSEKEVALAILKGLSFKEIAELRNTKEKTIRQQASTIYKKSNVTGRHEFSAWFFEDMLV